VPANPHTGEFSGENQIPIIAVTAFGNEYRSREIQAGCNDLISKPLDFDQLKPLLNQYL
jgi:CheY-like chemotaxis protein